MLSNNLLGQIPEINTPRLISKHTINLDIGCDVSYNSLAQHQLWEINRTHSPQHIDPHIKIAIPFEGAAFEAIWQTRTGQRKQQQVRSRHVCILPANLPHQVRLEHKHESIVIDFQSEFVDRIADELTGKNVEIVEQWAALDPLIKQLGIDLRREFQQQPPRILYIESVIQVLANHLVRNYSSNPVAVEDLTVKLTPRQLQQAIDRIHARLTQDITLSELADVVKMSQYRFARAFKQSTGMPPHQYLLSQRIDRAKQLLTNTQLSISDISYQLGFASQSHFTATFRRFTSVTPNLYRKEIGASF
jgi:AraC family transcriptional regulator